MPTEIEAKIRFDDFPALRQTLERLGAKLLREVVEHNLIFDHPNGILRKNDCGLRLRTCRDLTGVVVASSLTYKGARQEGEFKSRQEMETRIGEPSAMRAILETLDFQPVLQFTKARETWQFRDCVVELDDLPRLGRFVEVEGPSEAAVRKVLTKLNLADQPLVAESYVQMLLAK